MRQTLLNEYVERLDGYVDEAVESGEEFIEDSREEHIIDVDSQECRYCRLKGSKKFRLHRGAITLF
mgnify:CR=1 FL=1